MVKALETITPSSTRGRVTGWRLGPPGTPQVGVARKPLRLGRVEGTLASSRAGRRSACGLSYHNI